MKKGLILSAVVATILFSGCDKAKDAANAVKEKSAEVATQATEATKEVANNAVEATKEAATATAEAAKDTAKAAVEKTAEATKEVATKAVEGAKEAAQKATEATKEAATATAQTAKETAEKATESAKAAVEAPKADGKALFTVCAGCHGQKAEKKALGQSQVIGGWDAAKIENALKGYKAGTYGGAMKGVMQGQAAKLDDAKIKALAEYISTLK